METLWEKAALPQWLLGNVALIMKQKSILSHS